MNKNFFSYFLYSLIAVGFFSMPAFAKEHTSHAKSFIQHLQQKIQQKHPKSDQKNFSIQVDKKSKTVTVDSNKEIVSIKFPYQKNCEIETDLVDDELLIDYGINAFEMLLDTKGSFNIDQELNEAIDGLTEFENEPIIEDMDFSWSWERTDNYGYIDISMEFPLDASEDELNFDLENDQTLVQERLQVKYLLKQRVIFTKRNVYELFSETDSENLHLHEEFVNSFQIKS
jgi:hypothetical protein